MAAALGAVLCLWTGPAHADVVWPALFLEVRLLSVPAIIGGLVIEWIFYFYGLRLSWKKSAIVDIAINAASTLVGIIAIPIAGIVWEFFPGLLLNKIFIAGTFNPVTWAGTYAIAVFITTSIEIYAAKRIFNLISSRTDMLVVLGANAASVGIVFGSLFIFPLPV